MKHRITHGLSPELAKAAAEKAFATYAERFTEYRPVIRWLDATRSQTTFTVKGLTLTGTIEIGPRDIAPDTGTPPAAAASRT